MAKGILIKIFPMSPEINELYSKVKTSQHQGDSGFDLFVVNDQTIEGNSTDFIGLGIKVAAYKYEKNTDNFPTNENFTNENSDVPTEKNPTCDSSYKIFKNVSWLLMPRSSMSKTPLRMANSIGLIDSGYRGEVKIAVDNIKSEPYTVKRGDRLVQAVSFNGNPIVHQVVDELDTTSRGEGGFGSTTTTKVAPTEVQETNAAKKIKVN